jgi:SAM-dependent methyltransferase
MNNLKDSADDELKARHRAMWSMGDYPVVASEVIPDLGSILVDACGVRTGDRVLDVACGSGNAAIPAALRGARVSACDLTPPLLEAGRRVAEAQGVEISWREADAESLPYDDAEFDVVMSCVGVMFAPHHQASADELVRVCRPGGTIGLVNWTPEGFVGEMFSTMKPYTPPPPPGAQAPPLWGDEQHVRSLLGNKVTDVVASRRVATVNRFQTPEEFLVYFKANYGPTVSAFRGLADDPERASALERDLVNLARRYVRSSGDTIMEWEYLLLTARRMDEHRTV